MIYPTISEYVQTIKSSEDNFDQLKHLRPVLDEDGQPVMTSGNFAVVFKMKDEQTGKLHAVKCFLKEQEGRAEAYRQIAEELEYVSSTFLTPIKYLDKELFVDSANSEDSEFPVLLMDWVEGQTLDKYIREHIDDQYELSLLAYQFSRLAMWLMPQPFAHGDLKPDNILVKEDGTLVLVDYDGMYVPAMKGQKARELGSPDFRHPGRTEEVFDDHIDDFSLASILLSLKAISLQPDLLEEYGASDRLLFSEKDYRNLSESSVLGALQPLMQDAELASLYSLFILALSQNNLSQVSFRLFNLSRPDKSQYEEENLSTEVTDEDLANAWIDEYGVMYSKDRKRLLKAPQNLEEYIINRGTKVICNSAFRGCDFLESIYIPNSVIEIGERSFCGCCLENVTIPLGVRIIGDLAFAMMGVRLSIIIPNSVTTIGAAAFSGCHIEILRIPESMTKVEDDTFYNCALNSIIIPNSVTEIGDDAFDDRVILEAIYVPAGTKRKFKALLPKYKNVILENDDFISAWTDSYGVMYSPDRKRLLKATKPLQEYFVQDNIAIIKSNAFKLCNIISVTLPDGVLEIEDEAFAWCEELKNVMLPNSLIKIGNRAFENCGFSSINLPNGLLEIGGSSFSKCNYLSSIFIPKNVRIIREYAFSCCKDLTKIDVDINNPFYDSRDNCNAIVETKSDTLIIGCKSTIIPYNIKTIGKGAFCLCENLTSIQIPNSVTRIEDAAFACCESLTSIRIPKSVSSIGVQAFEGCKSITSIHFSSCVAGIEDVGFWNCESLISIIIPTGTKSFFEEMLPNLKDKLVEQDKEKNLSTEVTDEDLANAWTDEFGVKYSADKKRLLKAPREIKGYYIPNGTEIICNHAFMGELFYEDFLKSVYIPNSVYAIGKYAFANNRSLDSIQLPNSIVAIKEAAFKDCRKLSYIIIPDSIKQIEKDTFCGCGLKSMQLPEGLINIGDGAFAGCNFSKIIIPNNVISIGKKGFSSNILLTNLTIPANVAQIGQEAFVGCYNLFSIVVEKNNKYYDSRNDCNAIIETRKDTLILGCNATIIPNSVTKIGYRAFCDSFWLLSTVIPESVNEISDGAFELCKNLRYITFCSELQKIGKTAFNECGIETIFVPAGKKTIFEKQILGYKGVIKELQNDWVVKEIRPFTSEEISTVSRAEVVYANAELEDITQNCGFVMDLEKFQVDIPSKASQFKYTVRFYMPSGGYKYLPLSNQSTLKIGDSIDVNTAKLIILCREGYDDIYRVIE